MEGVRFPSVDLLQQTYAPLALRDLGVLIVASISTACWLSQLCHFEPRRANKLVHNQNWLDLAQGPQSLSSEHQLATAHSIRQLACGCDT
jgi:hypothetical protein